MVDRYYESGHAVSVPGGSERGYVCEKEKEFGKLSKLNNNFRKRKVGCVKVPDFLFGAVIIL